MRDFIEFGVKKIYSRCIDDEVVFKREAHGGGIIWAGRYTRGFHMGRRIIDIDGACPTLVAGRSSSFKILVDGMVRCLTTREAWRLMGFSDADYDAAVGVCKSQGKLWALAGNSIALPVLKALFSQMISPP